LKQGNILIDNNKFNNKTNKKWCQKHKDLICLNLIIVNKDSGRVIVKEEVSKHMMMRVCNTMKMKELDSNK